MFRVCDGCFTRAVGSEEITWICRAATTKLATAVEGGFFWAIAVCLYVVRHCEHLVRPGGVKTRKKQAVGFPWVVETAPNKAGENPTNNQRYGGNVGPDRKEPNRKERGKLGRLEGWSFQPCWYSSPRIRRDRRKNENRRYGHSVKLLTRCNTKLPEISRCCGNPSWNLMAPAEWPKYGCSPKMSCMQSEE